MKPDIFDYAVIVAATAGTLVYLFLMILIVGYRRRRTFERVLFFLALAAFCVDAAVLLGLNVRLQYIDYIPSAAGLLLIALSVIGIGSLPGLTVHVNAAYREIAERRRNHWILAVLTIAMYASLPVGLVVSSMRVGHLDLSEAIGTNWFGTFILVDFVVAAGISCGFQLTFASAKKRMNERRLAAVHVVIGACAAIIGVALVLSRLFAGFQPQWEFFSGIGLGAIPGALVCYQAVQTGTTLSLKQRNLAYSVCVGFLAVLYLALVRRVSGWLEPYFPPEATSAVLIFVLIGFFEPLQRFANRVLRRNVEQQLEQLQRLTNELQREAREGDLQELRAFAERRIREEFGLDIVKLNLGSQSSGVETPEAIRPSVPDVRPEVRTHKPGLENSFPNGGRIHSVTHSEAAELDRPAWAGQPLRLRLGKAGAEIGVLVAVPIGSSISGEAHAALEFLAEQLPGIIELCRAVDEKSRLERELAERERLALVGQMTASISHNLRNPLGSMKTVLQVQLENPRLEDSVRRDLQMVLGELDRLGGKLNALLRYARPAIRGAETARQIEVAQVAEEVVGLMKNEAARKDATLQLHEAPTCGCIRGSEEALNDILSNLLVNAIEAVAKSGRVDVRLGGDESNIEIAVVDDGPGIGAGQQTRLFQPFFTTKASGTGLGLAIVRRRATELGGAVSCRSPIVEGRGAEFIVRLPRMKC